MNLETGVKPERNGFIRVIKKKWVSRMNRPERYSLKEFKLDTPFFVMLIIPTLYFVLFRYWPIFGLSMGFQDFKLGGSFFGSDIDWVGFKWFEYFFNSPFFWRVVRNTFLISLYSLVFVFPLGIIVALVFNEIQNRRIKGFVQTVSYLPYFISLTVVVGMLTNFLSVNGGIVNQIINLLGFESVDFMGSNDWFRFIYIGSDAWQQVGFNSIVYIAAIAGINPELYEAAYVDGSTRFKNIILITLPCILPTIIFMLILRMGNIMSVGYEKIILMYSGRTYEVADVISTFAYRNGIVDGKFSYGAAIGLFNSIINLSFLLFTNKMTKKFSDTSLW